MVNKFQQFAEASGSANGISAFNLNLKSFLFQLTTFMIVLLVIRRWVLPKIVETLEKRRETLERSLAQARQTEEMLAIAEVKAAELIAKARAQADESLAGI